jgi:hypothetical protein
MASELELWAIALKVERDHGAQAPVFIAGRIGAAAVAGDEDGIARWKAVASRYDQLSQLGTVLTPSNLI